MKAGIKATARRGLRRAAATSMGQRTLGWLADQGLVPDRAPAAAPAPRPEHDVLQELWDRRVDRLPPPTFEDLTELPDDDTVPPLDRGDVDLTGCTDDQRQWATHGFVRKDGFVPDALLDEYWRVRCTLDRPHGWESTAPYLHVPEVMALATYKPLNDLLDELIGEPMATSLNLTGIVSTERNWHQDDYLNPPSVNGWYAAVWFAVGDIDPDSGPFQFVPGSHRWPVLRRDRVRLFLTPEERADHRWPRYTERFLDDVLDERIRALDAPVETFLGRKGDVLVWHSRLVHRGSLPAVAGTIRRSFIAHYTGVHHWPAGPAVGTAPGGGRYIVQDVPLEPAS